MQLRIDWMDGYGNDPRIEVFDEIVPKWPSIADAVWEQINGLHRADGAVFVHYFYNDMSGKPTEGFGGRKFTGVFKNGIGFEYTGAWSSRAGCINRAWPQRRIVDVHCGYYATAVHADLIIAHWMANRDQYDFGLAWAIEPNGEMTLQPTRNGKVKNLRPNYIYEHL